MSQLLTKENRIECRPLLEAAHITIYRRSAFRITGFPVDASAKAISKHADKLKMMQELGQGQGANSAAFALDPPPSVDQIRESIQRLKDPEHRIIDEFFWFWPERYAEGGEDPAIQAISQGDSLKAYELWLERENRPDSGFIASHNIAVMFHLIALDWTLYHLAMEVDQEREEKIRGYWRESQARWKKTAIDDRIWDTIRARIRSLEDPRLGTGFAQRMRNSLPVALDRINAEVALRFAEQECFDWARTHIDFVHETNQDLDDITTIVDTVLSPIRDRVHQYIQIAKEETKTDPKNAHQSVRCLFENCLPPLKIYEIFHKRDAHQKTELFDDVALTGVDCLVSYQNATGDNETSIELLHTCLPFAATVEVRQRVEANIKIGEQNLRWKALEPLYNRLKTIQERKEKAQMRLDRIKREMMPELMTLAERVGNEMGHVADLSNAVAVTLRNISIDAYNNERDFQTAAAAIQLASKLAKEPELCKGIDEDCKVTEEALKESICHFCGVQASAAACECQVPMYGDVQRNWGRINYRHMKVAVPRCHACNVFHNEQSGLSWAIIIACIVLGACIGSYA